MQLDLENKTTGYHFKSIRVSKLAIIGAGQIGPDIMLHFSKVFAKRGVSLVLVDIAEEAIRNARIKIEKKIQKGLETGAFKSTEAEYMKNSIHYTLSYSDIAGSDIVLEAATEDENIKDKIFKQVESLCDEKCLFLSNSSHMQPEVIFKNVSNRSRCLVTHYFFPAERNPVVELIPSAGTDQKLVEDLTGFYEAIGKVPIVVTSSYGYAIDPIFEGLCRTALLCLERGLGTEKEIDKVAMDTLGLGVGPFTALNLTGGNPITDHGLDEMGRKLMPWFKSPDKLKEAVRSGVRWQTAARGETIVVTPEKRGKIAHQFLGAYFGLASWIIDLGITTVHDLDMACELALVVKPPFTLMNEVGLDRALAVVKEFCGDHEGFKLPASLEKAAIAGKWGISCIVRSVRDDAALLTIRRPRVLNALNSAVMDDLLTHLKAIDKDSSLVGTILTGFGTKAFVSGADINQLASCKTPEEGIQTSLEFQRVLNEIEKLKKPIICALNGFAFGGGNELAMACTLRISRKNLPIAVCQPEVNLGFIPGAGGTQRLPRLVGLEKGAQILRTGKPISSAEAHSIGLIYKEVEGDLIDEALSLLRLVVDKKIEIAPLARNPLGTGGTVPELDIGHLSRKTDEILCKAIYEGAWLPLEEGLKLEAKLFGECMKTEDMKIGLKTFMEQGPRARAPFVHR